MLLKNNRYDLTVRVGNQEFHDYFYTKLDPLYNTVEAVRNSEVGRYLEEISDEEILLQLYDASEYAKEFADENHLCWDKEKESPPYPVRKFVLEKTKHDLIKFTNLFGTMMYRSASLADFDITSPDIGQLDPILDDMKRKVNRWRKKIIGPNTKYAVPHKKDDYLGRRNLERTRWNTKAAKILDEKRRANIKQGRSNFRRGHAEAESSVMQSDLDPGLPFQRRANE